MTIDWSFKTQAYRPIRWANIKADIQAEVIASKTESAEYREFFEIGPGRITDLDINREKIYE